MSATNVRSQLSPVTCSTKKLVMAPPGDQMAERYKKGFEHPPGDQGSNCLFTHSPTPFRECRPGILHTITMRKKPTPKKTSHQSI